MSHTLCRALNPLNRRGAGINGGKLVLLKSNYGFLNADALPTILQQKVTYSKRSSAKDLDKAFKVVKSKVRVGDDFSTYEGGPNWELLSPRGNRFYFPNSIGPAWQGANTTIHTEVPLQAMVDFNGEADQPQKLRFKLGECPSLIKDSLHEIFPAPEVVTSKKLTLITLSFSGDCEAGAAKFVLAAREISERLRLHGYWADFMNPFSGKPFFSWANGKNLYKIDKRFRGINMKVMLEHNCLVISSEKNVETSFSGAIYTTGPAECRELISVLEKRLYGNKEDA